MKVCFDIFLGKKFCNKIEFLQYRSLSSLVSNSKEFVNRTLQTDPWGNISSQRAFMDTLAKKLNIKHLAGWYKISSKIYRQHGGAELLQLYNGSHRKLLTTVYPEYLWNLFWLISNNTNGIIRN